MYCNSALVFGIRVNVEDDNKENMSKERFHCQMLIMS